MRRSSWQTLRPGDPGALTLTVDFTSTGRTQACFRDLVPHLDVPGDIWETVAPGVREAADMSGDDYVDRWADEVVRSGQQAAVVLGYCVGAVFAAPLAQRLAARQAQPPRLVLLDPELPNTLGLYRDFHRVADALATILSEEELAQFHDAGFTVRDTHGYGDISVIGPALADIFRGATTTAAERLGLDDDIRDELTGAFASFVHYLSAAQTIDPRARWAEAVAVVSDRSVTSDLQVAEEIRVDVDHDELLRHPEVGRAVSEVVARACDVSTLAG
ncbi:thioesterase domain-containing protein [Micromonospora sp. WMMD1082]|uniref:thioesterase domain-containing protein n=1 Tax=Micromonospora sp. WMMD1082 TaxID=3016104 RepID=UPI0024178D3A|nr:thioesterase domain-containing protein [Micromonospora sp. WMMD1082]MDG4794554.1 thioesterase domain-containing protein [Micromonospora sp. WMMD1082]